MDGGAARDAEEHGMGPGCGAPTLEKAVVAGEDELYGGCASGGHMLRWGKKMSLSFLETVKNLRWSEAGLLGPMAAQA